MNEIRYDFVDIDSDESFAFMGESLGGVLQGNTLRFDNYLAKGELVKMTPEPGLWMRRWNLTVFQKIKLHKQPASPELEKKCILVYFMNPDIFGIKSKNRNIPVKGAQKSIFLTSQMEMDFSVLPNQPFYVLDIALTDSWLHQHFADADPLVLAALNQQLNSKKSGLVKPCCVEEYTTLNDLEFASPDQQADLLFTRSRIYNLIVLFLNKLVNEDSKELIGSTINYKQVTLAQQAVTTNLYGALKIEEIAKAVNMSVSSLSRQFKMVYGRTIGDYHMEKRMELARMLLLEKNYTVSEVANMFGYHQSSSFIACFSKHYGYSPGILKTVALQN